MIRASVYITLREKGQTPAKAASYAKDVTVNFNRRGNVSSSIGSLFLFFNASVQGSERLLRPYFSDDKKIKRRALQTMAFLPALSIALSMMARLVGGEDEDEEYYYDKLPAYERQHNILIPNVFSDSDNPSDRFFKIPLPYGFNVFFAVPDHAVRAVFGIEKPVDAMLNSLSVILNSFSPLGAPEFGNPNLSIESEALRMFMPTIGKPALDHALNENFAGYPIYKETFGGQTPRPDSQMYFTNVNPVIRDFTDFVNTLTGGDKEESGFADWNPEVIEHYVSSYGGGVYSFINNTVTTGAMIASGDNPMTFEGDRIKKVPFVRRFVTSVREGESESTFYENMKEIKARKDIFNRKKKGLEPVAANEYRKEHMGYFQLQAMAETTDKKTSEIDDKIKRLESMPQNTEVKQRIEQLEQVKRELYLNFNKKYNQVINEGKGLSLKELIGGE
jgi:hypothetical protein